MTIRRFINYWEDRSRSFILLTAVVVIAVLAVIDFFTGSRISFSLFFTLPIAFVTWFVGRKTGLIFAIICAVIWQSVNILSGEVFTHPAIPVWNAATRFGFFAIIIFLLSGIRRLLEQEEEMSHTDFLTGAMNSRAFYTVAGDEMERFRRYRHAFTIAYIDLDNFKTVNDRFGHSAGDDLLQAVTGILGKNLRANDVVSRLGGDEFALLLPETGQSQAKVVMQKALSALMESMQENNWPVTFSAGIITCREVPDNVDSLIEFADRLMYEVKSTGKNALKYRVYDGT